MEIAGAHYSSSGFNTLEDVQFMSRQPSMVSGRRILEDVIEDCYSAEGKSIMHTFPSESDMRDMEERYSDSDFKSEIDRKESIILKRNKENKHDEMSSK